MKTLSLYLMLSVAAITACQASEARFIYQDDQVALLADRLEVQRRTLSLEDLGDSTPENPMTLTGVTPLTDAPWQVEGVDEKPFMSTHHTNSYSRLPDGTLSCYKDKLGKVHERRDALGTALAVLSGVVEGDAAKQAIVSYPTYSWGAPTFSPYFQHEKGYHKKEYHNNTSWPFVTELFMQALQQATGEDNTARAALMHARPVRFTARPGFSELMKHGGHLTGATGQLWSAAAFVNLCRRAGLTPLQ